MLIVRDKLLTLRSLQHIRVCDEGMKLTQSFLDAAEECVINSGRTRTSSMRAVLLLTHNAMVDHTGRCNKCNAFDQRGDGTKESPSRIPSTL